MNRSFNITDGSEIVEIILYDYGDKNVNGAISHDGPIFYQINPLHKNQFLAWNYTNTQNTTTYYRILDLPPFILKFIKSKFPFKFKNIKVSITNIYISPNTPTKMYLIKGDEVEIIEEKDDWLKIRYYGNGATSRKTIEGWIKKSDVE